MYNLMFKRKRALCLFAFMLGIVVSGFATKKTNIYQGYLFAYLRVQDLKKSRNSYGLPIALMQGTGMR